jgi:hypothetical protein
MTIIPRGIPSPRPILAEVLSPFDCGGIMDVAVGVCKVENVGEEVSDPDGNALDAAREPAAELVDDRVSSEEVCACVVVVVGGGTWATEDAARFPLSP